MEEAGQKILVLIGQNRAQTKYSIAKNLGISYRWAAQAIDDLVRKGALIGEEISKTHAGLPKKAYSLTLYGLYLTMQSAYILSVSQLDLEKIIQNWKSLDSTLLQRWTYFKDEMGEESKRLLSTYQVALSLAAASDDMLVQELDGKSIILSAQLMAEPIVFALLNKLKQKAEERLSNINFFDNHFRKKGVLTLEDAIQADKKQEKEKTGWLQRETFEENWRLNEKLRRDFQELLKLVKKWMSVLRSCDPHLAKMVDDWILENKQKLEAAEEVLQAIAD
jgi:hypothetical protein